MTTCQHRHGHPPLHEDEADRAHRGDHVDDEQDQRADRAGPREGRAEDLPVAADAHDDDASTTMSSRTASADTAGVPCGDSARQSALGTDDIAVHREQQSRRADHAGQAAGEGADRRAQRDHVTDPRADVGRAEVAHQRTGPDERADALRVRTEAHHLDGGDDDEVDPAEDRGAENGARDVAARVGGLLAERRRRLEPGEGQEAEHDAEEHVAGRRARRDGEHVQRELLVPAVRNVAR